jgi:hypothetical protein
MCCASEAIGGDPLPQSLSLVAPCSCKTAVTHRIRYYSWLCLFRNSLLEAYSRFPKIPVGSRRKSDRSRHTSTQPKGWLGGESLCRHCCVSAGCVQQEKHDRLAAVNEEQIQTGYGPSLGNDSCKHLRGERKLCVGTWERCSSPLQPS